MKKITTLVLVTFTFFIFIACSDDDKNNSTSNDADSGKTIQHDSDETATDKGDSFDSDESNLPDSDSSDVKIPDQNDVDEKIETPDNDFPSDSRVPTIAGCQIFPADNMWNTPIDEAELHPLSDTYIASIGADTELHPDFGTVWNGYTLGIPFVVVPEDQPPISVSFLYDDESDSGPYPIPPDAPVEGGENADGDRHVLVLQEKSCILYEMYNARPQSDGSWTGGSGAIWHLDKNEVRPNGWTSADAAGLAILPGLLKYEDVYELKEVNHALRVTISSLQSGYILPATHSDGTCGHNRDCPPMGLRLRLKASFDVSGFDENLQIIFNGMKKFGLVIADTGADMFVTGAHDMRWNDDLLHAFHEIRASDFEAVYSGEIIDY